MYNVVLVGGLLDTGNRALADAIGGAAGPGCHRPQRRRALRRCHPRVPGHAASAGRPPGARPERGGQVDDDGAARAPGGAGSRPRPARPAGRCGRRGLQRRGVTGGNADPPRHPVPLRADHAGRPGRRRYSAQVRRQLRRHPNYLGAFAPPSGVLVEDPAFLQTVPVEHLRCGLAEIVKVALMLDADLFDRVAADGPELIRTGFTAPSASAKHFLARAVELMLDELSDNSYEDRTLERLVDFGHTFSGRLEELSDYRLLHGQAVAIDIALSTALAAELRDAVRARCGHRARRPAPPGPADRHAARDDGLAARCDRRLRPAPRRPRQPGRFPPPRSAAARSSRTPDHVPHSALAAALARVRSATEGSAGRRPRQLQV